MGYKILGYAVWNGGKLFLRLRYKKRIPSKRVVAAGLAAVALGGVAAVAVTRSSE